MARQSFQVFSRDGNMNRTSSARSRSSTSSSAGSPLVPPPPSWPFPARPQSRSRVGAAHKTVTKSVPASSSLIQISTSPAFSKIHGLQLQQRLNLKVRQYFEDAKKPVDGGPWLGWSEIPTSGELLDIDTDSSPNSSVMEIVPNKLQRAWGSKGKLIYSELYFSRIRY